MPNFDGLNQIQVIFLDIYRCAKLIFLLIRGLLPAGCSEAIWRQFEENVLFLGNALAGWHAQIP